ncbi:RecX family transcriptional regulator [Deminuibacter soli]|uniref:Regulatory protein RecX n=2 Tax=Deminuibacter soli TaxID=2291815 RepID=A0A3E1NRS8_9BACT|nr:RecX family transcriptional regulator [Deminuibacter soli]
MGLYKSDVETILAQLIEEDYLNESRYAEQFAGGHFRTKKWGRKKIRYELSLKRVSTYNINRAIKSIDEDAYQAMVLQLVTARWQQLEKETPLVRKMKTTSYLLQKGFEPELIQAAIQQMPV